MLSSASCPSVRKIKHELCGIEESFKSVREKSRLLRSTQVKELPVRSGVDKKCEKVDPKESVSVLQRDLERRKKTAEASFEVWERKIAGLEEEVLEWRCGERDQEDEGLTAVYALQRCVKENLESFEERRASILRERERELQRAMRARLADVAVDLGDKRSTKYATLRKWQQRAEQLKEDAKHINIVRAQLQSHHDSLREENKTLRLSIKRGEDDRKDLIHQLATVKKETGRIVQVVECLELEQKTNEELLKAKVSDTGGDNVPRTHHHHKKEFSKTKTLEEIKHLERLLDHQQRTLVSLRLDCVTQAEESVALQKLLSNRLEDLKEQRTDLKIHDNRTSRLLAPAGNPAENKEQLDSKAGRLAWESRILTILYQLAFPPLKKQFTDTLLKINYPIIPYVNNNI